MKYRKILTALTLTTVSLAGFAQVENAGGVMRRSERENKESASPGVSDRMQGFYQTKETHDADLSYLKQVYRRLDLEKGPNAALYYPEDVIDGQENLFRIILRLVVDGKIPAYEYLDGREIFTDQYKVNVGDMLTRFDIYAQPAKGSTERNPRYVIEEADVPAGQVMNYYILEKWEFDRRSNAMKTTVEAICPVLNRYGDFGGDARYPMFWVKFDALRPYLAQQFVFISDDNNIPQYSLDDYFNLGLYDGEIYKTRNLRNQSLAQMFPDEDDMKRAQDSIDNHLRNFGKNLWVPSREEYLAMKESTEGKQKKGGKKNSEADELPVRTISVGDSAVTVVTTVVEEQEDVPVASARAKKKTTAKKPAKKQPKASSPSSSSNNANSAAEKSVRRRKR
ncbi:MAG: gliding motility protein GldN [Muribaculaceae bacterium]|nr:gliding motility protein GldN [Muribaculaceae bacterium]